MKGWTLSGEPAELRQWQELAVMALLGWCDGERTVTLVMRGEEAGKSAVLATAGRYARARAKGKPLRDDPVRDRDQQEDE